MMSVGPFSVRIIILALASLIAWLVARFMRRGTSGDTGKAAASVLLDALLVGLIAARAGYVARWWPEYGAAPASIVAIGDGGFDWWIGLPAALVFILWKTRRARAVRLPALAGIAAGMLAWGAALGTLTTLQRATPGLSSLRLQTLDAVPEPLARYIGRPVVMNLWASWCPPCRREMPLFSQAQSDYPGVVFLMANQGENAATVRAFLAQEGLTFSDIVLDPTSLAMRAFGSRGLPTTLFFDAHGKLVDAHLGELTAARLKDAVQAIQQPSRR
ncbi:Thiol-disulfide oxidoreductase ResA [Ralstonia condita]|uniref:Thiol-disulfide oxidoreductase ResA n=1 Tax=Ralstonia condita TaxID=3058600 RepID=A0ABM9IX57_9RALS|nr:TlpA disulfide reductase family protein [Ralstonia sp. LMG 7141]CAJ0775218.1 Thiol-disulfide oxidoreductase ResA [Ralstonia sp. LMG 7141]